MLHEVMRHKFLIKLQFKLEAKEMHQYRSIVRRYRYKQLLKQPWKDDVPRVNQTLVGQFCTGQS